MIIKQFIGHSGAIVNLSESDNRLVVEKSGMGTARNYTQMIALGHHVPQPRLLSYTDQVLTMEYVPSTDMIHYLINENRKPLINFIKSTYTTLSGIVYNTAKDYMPVYQRRLAAAEWLPASAAAICQLLPRYLQQTLYHGDFTMNNILYDYNNARFVLIDAVTTDLDSIHFDISKLRQDLDCKWFVRDTKVLLSNRLLAINEELASHCEYYNNNAMAILTLLRVWPYSTPEDKQWLAEQLDKLWKQR
jgi:tRNA A-37 threonylcarbamoyl transferase component Bud32